MSPTYHKPAKTQYLEFLGTPRPEAEFRARGLNTGFSKNQAGVPLDQSKIRSPNGKPAVFRHSARNLRVRVDLVGFVRQFTRLRRSGQQFIGSCPLHSERHPSFYVRPEKQVFYCFGCGAGGDVFDFVMHAAGCDFRRALGNVAEFSERVARDSETQSGSRFDAGEGAQPLSAAKRRVPQSQSSEDSRARILTALDEVDRRLRRIEGANCKASADLGTACEPERGGFPFT